MRMHRDSSRPIVRPTRPKPLAPALEAAAEGGNAPLGLHEAPDMLLVCRSAS